MRAGVRARFFVRVCDILAPASHFRARFVTIRAIFVKVFRFSRVVSRLRLLRLVTYLNVFDYIDDVQASRLPCRMDLRRVKREESRQLRAIEANQLEVKCLLLLRTTSTTLLLLTLLLLACCVVCCCFALGWSCVFNPSAFMCARVCALVHAWWVDGLLDPGVVCAPCPCARWHPLLLSGPYLFSVGTPVLVVDPLGA